VCVGAGVWCWRSVRVQLLATSPKRVTSSSARRQTLSTDTGCLLMLSPAVARYECRLTRRGAARVSLCRECRGGCAWWVAFFFPPFSYPSVSCSRNQAPARRSCSTSFTVLVCALSCARCHSAANKTYCKAQDSLWNKAAPGLVAVDRSAPGDHADTTSPPRVVAMQNSAAASSADASSHDAGSTAGGSGNGRCTQPPPPAYYASDADADASAPAATAATPTVSAMQSLDAHRGGGQHALSVVSGGDHRPVALVSLAVAATSTPARGSSGTLAAATTATDIVAAAALASALPASIAPPAPLPVALVRDVADASAAVARAPASAGPSPLLTFSRPGSTSGSHAVLRAAQPLSGHVAARPHAGDAASRIVAAHRALMSSPAAGAPVGVTRAPAAAAAPAQASVTGPVGARGSGLPRATRGEVHGVPSRVEGVPSGVEGVPMGAAPNPMHGGFGSFGGFGAPPGMPQLSPFMLPYGMQYSLPPWLAMNAAAFSRPVMDANGNLWVRMPVSASARAQSRPERGVSEADGYGGAADAPAAKRVKVEACAAEMAPHMPMSTPHPGFMARVAVPSFPHAAQGGRYPVVAAPMVRPSASRASLEFAVAAMAELSRGPPLVTAASTLPRGDVKSAVASVPRAVAAGEVLASLRSRVGVTAVMVDDDDGDDDAADEEEDGDNDDDDGYGDGDGNGDGDIAGHHVAALGMHSRGITSGGSGSRDDGVVSSDGTLHAHSSDAGPFQPVRSYAKNKHLLANGSRGQRCDECGAVFSTNVSLRRHQSTHAKFVGGGGSGGGGGGGGVRDDGGGAARPPPPPTTTATTTATAMTAVPDAGSAARVDVPATRYWPAVCGCHLRCVCAAFLRRCVVSYCSVPLPSSRAVCAHLALLLLLLLLLLLFLSFSACFPLALCVPRTDVLRVPAVPCSHASVGAAVHPSMRFSCAHCGYRSDSLQNVVRHERTHTGEKPFGCDLAGCSFRTSRKSSLHRHLLRHSGLKPYACSFPGCEYRSVSVDNVTRHERVHTGERPFVCLHCSYKASDGGTLRRHMNRRHPKDGVDVGSGADDGSDVGGEIDDQVA
jgi:hypothetical protein